MAQTSPKQAGERNRAACFCAVFWLILVDFSLFNRNCAALAFWFTGITNRNMKNVFDGSNIPKQAGERNRAACFCAFFWLILVDFGILIGTVQRWHSIRWHHKKKHEKRLWWLKHSQNRQAKEIVLPVFVCSFLDDSCCFFSFQQNFAEQIAKTNQNPVQSCKFFQKASKISRSARN